MKQDYTDIVIVLDRSGSMASVRNDTIGGFNKFVDEQRNVPGEARLTLVQFDDQYEPGVIGAPIREVKPLTHDTYLPRGFTALHGAIGKTIQQAGERFTAMLEAERPAKVIFVIVTDGEENSSHKYEWSRAWDMAKVREMIEHQTNAYKWQFVYIGANQDAVLNAQRIGVAASNAINYTANAVGTQDLYDSLSANVVRMRCSNSSSMKWSDEDREKQKKAAAK